MFLTRQFFAVKNFLQFERSVCFDFLAATRGRTHIVYTTSRYLIPDNTNILFCSFLLTREEV